jgi:hypothetical protein
MNSNSFSPAAWPRHDANKTAFEAKFGKDGTRPSWFKDYVTELAIKGGWVAPCYAPSQRNAAPRHTPGRLSALAGKIDDFLISVGRAIVIGVGWVLAAILGLTVLGVFLALFFWLLPPIPAVSGGTMFWLIVLILWINHK